MKITYITTLTTAILLALFISITPANAAPAVCTTLTTNMSLTQTDVMTNGEVSKLQAVLNARGYLNVTPTGYFGPLTYAAVVKFQGDNMVPTTGFVGTLTRAAIKANSCATTNTTPQATTTKPTTNATQTPAVIVNTPPKMDSFYPSRAAVDSRVTIRGSGFSTSSNTVYFGNGAVLKGLKSSDGKNLAFIVPSTIGQFIVNPNVYLVSVANAYGTSSALSFTVTATIVAQPSLTNATPTKAYAGAKVTLNGTNFSLVKNIVTFYSNGLIATSTVASSNGRSLSITIPTKISTPCSTTPGTVCNSFSQNVKEGDQLVVTVNSTGLNSNSITIPIIAKP